MKIRFLPIILGIITFIVGATASAQQQPFFQFTGGPIDFSSPPGIWIDTSKGVHQNISRGNVGHILISAGNNSYRIDVFDDGGRFLIRSYCHQNRTLRERHIRSVTFSTDGRTAYRRNCDRTRETIPRAEAVMELYGLLPNMDFTPPAIDIYLLQLDMEFAIYERQRQNQERLNRN